MLTKLREIGVQIQIDDFGTGYSSLSILHDLPIDTLKIDRTFIQQLEGTNSGMETVRMILSLAHSLGMKVVAEGVETDYQLSSLQSMSCEYAQGFLFAKPVNNMEADLLLSNVYKKKED
jgi:EAL domain-containing protein (putative c-di-GMP-specific phosphodiesterase class I)